MECPKVDQAHQGAKKQWDSRGARRFRELHLEHWPTFEGECEVRPLEAEAP